MDEFLSKVKRTIAKARMLLVSRRHAYKSVFGSVFGPVVMADLVKFCRGTESTFDSDPRIHALLEGRREVLLRIAQLTNLSFDELWAIYDGRVDRNE